MNGYNHVGSLGVAAVVALAGPEGMALIFTWLRLSSLRQLDWYRKRCGCVAATARCHRLPTSPSIAMMCLSMCLWPLPEARSAGWGSVLRKPHAAGTCLRLSKLQIKPHTTPPHTTSPAATTSRRTSHTCRRLSLSASLTRRAGEGMVQVPVATQSFSFHQFLYSHPTSPLPPSFAPDPVIPTWRPL